MKSAIRQESLQRKALRPASLGDPFLGVLLLKGFCFYPGGPLMYNLNMIVPMVEARAPYFVRQAELESTWGFEPLGPHFPARGTRALDGGRGPSPLPKLT